MYKIGVVGYSAKKFDQKEAEKILNTAFAIIEKINGNDDYMVVSGLTNIGIPAIAYRLANSRGWKTSGIACKKAEEYDCFPVDEKRIIGEEWGDESKSFIHEIDCFVRVGGGEQSKKEAKMAKERDIKVYEYELPEKK